jgi:hypothetical protein
MKKLLVVAGVVSLILSANAEFLTFGDGAWLSQGLVNDSSSVQMATVSTNGVTFTLTLSSLNGSNIFANGSNVGIFGGVSNSRIDSGSNNGTDNETMKLGLSVSGSALVSLALDNVELAFIAGNGERAGFSDRFAASYTATQGVNIVTGVALTGAGLEALSTSNVGGQGSGLWELNITGLDNLVTSDTNFSLRGVTIDYVVPEPSTISLLGVSAGLLWLRRKRRF